MQQKPAIFTLIYKAGNKYAGGERHEKKDHHCGINMREVNVMKKRIIITVVIILFIIVGYLVYWKYPSGRDTMSWARSLRVEDVEKIELIVQPSDENERYKLLSQEEMDTAVKLINKSHLSQEEMDAAVKLINKSHGKYVEEPEPVTGLSRLLIVTMADGNIHKVSYGGYLTIDGDSYMDHPGGYSEEGGILGTGGKSVPEY